MDKFSAIWKSIVSNKGNRDGVTNLFLANIGIWIWDGRDQNVAKITG